MEETNKSKNVIIILLTILCISLIVFIIFMVSKNNKDNKKPVEEDPKDIIMKETTKSSIYQVNSNLSINYLDNTMKAFDSPLANRSNDLKYDLYGYYYRRNSVLIEDLNYFALAYIGLYHHSVEQYKRTDLEVGKELCVSRDTIHNIVNNKFRKLNFDDLKPNDELMVYGDTYKFKIDEYCAFIGGGRGGPNEQIENVIYGYKEFTDKIEIFAKVIFIYNRNAESMGEIPIVVDLYKDVDRMTKLLEKEEDFNVSKFTKEELDLFDTFKFTYKKDNNSLYFYSVDKISE